MAQDVQGTRKTRGGREVETSKGKDGLKYCERQFPCVFPFINKTLNTQALKFQLQTRHTHTQKKSLNKFAFTGKEIR